MRLYCTHIQQLPLLVSPQRELPVSLNCVLQCEPLASGQEVEVRLGGVLLSGYQEEIFRVFAWRVLPQELTEVLLLHRGRPTKVWRGRWDGQQGLIHGGTLAIEVFLEQEAVAQASVPPPPEPSLPRADVFVSSNGHPPDVFPVVAVSPASPVSWPSVTFGDGDLVVLAGGVPLSSLPEREFPPAPAPAFSAPMEGEPRQRVSVEEQDLWTPADAARPSCSELEEENDGIREEEGEEENDGIREGGGDREEGLERAEEMEETPGEAEAPGPVAAFLVQLATFHAGQGVPFASLRDLISRMPSNTVVVDLRLHPKRQSVATTVFSKEQLRATFGALYWDRGALIQRTPQYTDGRWRTVITNLEAPSGVVSLLLPLQQGVSMVLLDGGMGERAVYAESVRAAVMNYLRTRPQLPSLTILSET